MEFDEVAILVSLREELETSQPELSAVFYELEDLYERKLWFQLCESLSEYIYKEQESRPVRLRLYQSFINEFSDKINQLQNVEFLVQSLVDVKPINAIEHLTAAKDKVIALGERRAQRSSNDLGSKYDIEIQQALVQIDLELAKIKIQLGFVDEASSIIDACDKSISDITGAIDRRVNSSLYSAKAQLSKVKGDYNSFYYNSLLFLACINDLEALENKNEIVRDICISGVLGDKIYNFGEIIMHDIMKSLEVSWLKQLLLALNAGDLQAYNTVLKDVKDVGEIQDNLPFLNQKMCIMGFIEMVFNSNKKTLSYEEVIKAIPQLQSASEVEHLVMKCLSLGLIKGSIAQVAETIEVSWIQPRTMTQAQIAATRERLSNWAAQATQVHSYMAQSGSEVYV